MRKRLLSLRPASSDENSPQDDDERDDGDEREDEHDDEHEDDDEDEEEVSKAGKRLRDGHHGYSRQDH